MLGVLPFYLHYVRRFLDRWIQRVLVPILLAKSPTLFLVMQHFPFLLSQSQLCGSKKNIDSQWPNVCSYGSVSKPCTPVVHIKIAGKWMFIPLNMVLIVIDPYPYNYHVVQAEIPRSSQATRVTTSRLRETGGELVDHQKLLRVGNGMASPSGGHQSMAIWVTMLSTSK